LELCNNTRDPKLSEVFEHKILLIITSRYTAVREISSNHTVPILLQAASTTKAKLVPGVITIVISTHGGVIPPGANKISTKLAPLLLSYALTMQAIPDGLHVDLEQVLLARGAELRGRDALVHVGWCAGEEGPVRVED
jgi:hypothetical protein